jgi:hypothetical protein
MNRFVEDGNAESRNKRRQTNNCCQLGEKVIKEMTEQEFWTFFGIVISARALGREGDMWGRHEWQDDGILPKANFDEHMKEHCFEQIRKHVVCIFAEPDKQDKDPWWMMSSAFKQCNKNRKAKVMSSIEKTLDKTMAAFRPQTRKCGDVPNLSSIPRKPEPLGMELKVIVCAVTGIAAWKVSNEGGRVCKGKWSDGGMHIERMSGCEKILPRGYR